MRCVCFPVHVCVAVFVNSCAMIASVSAYIELLVVFVLRALKSVFFGASLAHFEKTGAPVWGQRQLLQHDVLRHANFLPKIHLYIWTQGDKQTMKELVYTIYDLISDKTYLFIYLLSSHLLNLIEHKLYSHRKKSPLRGLLTWYSCQHDKRERIFPHNPLMSSACSVVSAAC